MRTPIHGQLIEFDIVHICLTMLHLHVLSTEVKQLSLLKCNETFYLTAADLYNMHQ